MKPDERALLLAVYVARNRPSPWRWPRAIIAGMDIVPKRAWYILEKWAGKRGWYEYGVCVDLGWLTPRGLVEAETQMAIAAAVAFITDTSIGGP